MGRFSKLETSTGEAQQGTEVPGSQLPSASANEPEYDANYYCSLGFSQFLRAKYDKALQLFSRATQKEPAHVDAWTGEILTLIAQRHYREANVWVSRAIEVLPENPRIVSLQGLVFAHQGLCDRGLQCSDYAMTKSASDPYVWFIRGQILSLAEKPHAEFCMGKALEVRRADDWLIPALIGLFYAEQKLYPRAEHYLLIAAKENTVNAALWFHLGKVQMRLSKWETARQNLEMAARLEPELREATQLVDTMKHSSWFARLLARFFPR